jgi:hypothetical protein
VSKPQFVPLPSPEVLPADEVIARAADFQARMVRRRPVRDFSDRPNPREVIDQCVRQDWFLIKRKPLGEISTFIS